MNPVPLSPRASFWIAASDPAPEERALAEWAARRGASQWLGGETMEDIEVAQVMKS